jgi:hypothetical protein
MHEGKILAMVSKSQEFEQLKVRLCNTPVNCLYTTYPLSKLPCILRISKVREDEMSEMDELMMSCRLPVQGGVENTYGKVNVLLQTYISCSPVESFSLTSDLAYVAQVREREREREKKERGGVGREKGSGYII